MLFTDLFIVLARHHAQFCTPRRWRTGLTLVKMVSQTYKLFETVPVHKERISAPILRPKLNDRLADNIPIAVLGTHRCLVLQPDFLSLPHLARGDQSERRPHVIKNRLSTYFTNLVV